VKQLEAGRAEVENQYARSVRPEGNVPAKNLIKEVFEVVPRKWRGLAEIPRSGLGLTERYAAFDAERRFGKARASTDETTKCLSGLVLQGAIRPHECPAFGKECTPNGRSAPPWFRRREPARHIIDTGERRRRSPDMSPNEGISCPVPISSYPQIVVAHGGGGRLTHQLIEKIFIAAFGSPELETRHDGAVLDISERGSPNRMPRLAFTTDSYVVRPLFFPGGDIGSLAVHGSVNDLAMCGARPLFLSAGFILEEGLPMETLWRVALSMGEAARASGVRVATGDTKVVEKGKGDGIFINTAGIGVLERDLRLAPSSVREGDAILLSGDIGRHGIAVLSAREGLSFESDIQSDSAPLARPVLELIRAGLDIHCMRDLTRGGLGRRSSRSRRLPASASRSTRPPSPSARMSREPARSSASTPSTWRTKAGFICFVPGRRPAGLSTS